MFNIDSSISQYWQFYFLIVLVSSLFKNSSLVCSFIIYFCQQKFFTFILFISSSIIAYNWSVYCFINIYTFPCYSMFTLFSQYRSICLFTLQTRLPTPPFSDMKGPGSIQTLVFMWSIDPITNRIFSTIPCAGIYHVSEIQLLLNLKRWIRPIALV